MLLHNNFKNNFVTLNLEKINLTSSEKFKKLSAIKAETENYEHYIPVHFQLQIKMFSACFQ